MNQDLKPCPFCASTNIDPEGWMSETNAGVRRTGPACDDCGASADSVERWNSRPLQADEDASAAAVLRKFVDFEDRYDADKNVSDDEVRTATAEAKALLEGKAQ